MAWVISHRYKLIFIHIPKTGGSSIACPGYKGVLLPYLGETDIVRGSHPSAGDLKKKFPDEWNNYFKFAVVRNPWERLVSSYFYFLGKIVGKDFDKKVETELGKKIAAFKNFHAFCRNLNQLPLDAHFSSQLDFITDEDENVIMDKVCRLEKINEDFAAVCSEVGLPNISLPVKRRTRHAHYSHYYTAEAIENVRRHYARDIDILGYEYEANTHLFSRIKDRVLGALT